MDGTNPIHTIIFAISFFGLVISIIVWCYAKERRGYLVAPISYLINVFAYNVALYLTVVADVPILSPQGIEWWSGIVRLHALFLCIGFILAQPYLWGRSR
jgi:hypothetical protein